jgi:hypothetical protein
MAKGQYLFVEDGELEAIKVESTRRRAFRHDSAAGVLEAAWARALPGREAAAQSEALPAISDMKAPHRGTPGPHATAGTFCRGGGHLG